MEKHPKSMMVFASSSGDRPRKVRGSVSGRPGHHGRVPIDRLKKNVIDFLKGASELVDASPSDIGGYRLDTIEIAAKVDGSGRIGLLGTGAEIGGGASIKFVLKNTKRSKASRG